MRRGTSGTTKKAKFLKAVADGASVTAAAGVAGIGRTTAYRWRDEDPQFATQWNDAEEQSIDLLEDAARARALDHSDLLLIFLLRHRRPSIYRPPTASAAVMALTLEDYRAVEENQRLRAMSQEEIQAELDQIDAKERTVREARASLA